jgi:hypothetical protein
MGISRQQPGIAWRFGAAAWTLHRKKAHVCPTPDRKKALVARCFDRHKSRCESNEQLMAESNDRFSKYRKKTKRFSKKLSDFLFSGFFNIFDFDKFCRTCFFEFFNSVFTKTLEMDSSFF